MAGGENMSERFTLNKTDLQLWLSTLVTTVLTAVFIYLTTVLGNLTSLTGIVTWQSFFGVFKFTPGIAIAIGTLIITNCIDLIKRYIKGPNGTN